MTDYSVANINKVDGGPAEENFPFAGLLEKEELRYLGSLMERHCAKRGECLWRQGDMDERLGLIVRGRVKILKETSTPNNPLIVGVFGPGALLIDLGFVEGSPRETSAYAVEDVQICYLSRSQLARVLAERPLLGHRILGEVLTSFGEQLRHAYRRLAAFL